MDFFEAVKRRRSVRKFKPGELPDEDLVKILEAGRAAPSGANVQNREFVVIRDPETIGKLKEIQDSFTNVAAVIAVVMTPTETNWGSYWVEDCSACVENMLLAIAALGYGSVWVEGTLLRKEAWAKQLLGVPDDKRLYVVLPVGHPAEEGESAAKRPLAAMAYCDRYGCKGKWGHE